MVNSINSTTQYCARGAVDRSFRKTMDVSETWRCTTVKREILFCVFDALNIPQQCSWYILSRGEMQESSCWNSICVWSVIVTVIQATQKQRTCNYRFYSVVVRGFQLFGIHWGGNKHQNKRMTRKERTVPDFKIKLECVNVLRKWVALRFIFLFSNIGMIYCVSTQRKTKIYLS